jgi:6-pyruvoyltetrahydropterin/6-carboxytetrahydropterin synthase
VFRITKRFSFSASHQLFGLAEDHPCARLHGHNYEVEVVLESDKLSDVGFVRDYRELDGFKAYIDANLDHQHLNRVLTGMNPTAENIAERLFYIAREHAPETVAVRVSETPKTWAEFRPEVPN